jgi:hypothetical protein
MGAQQSAEDYTASPSSVLASSRALKSALVFHENSHLTPVTSLGARPSWKKATSETSIYNVRAISADSPKNIVEFQNR